MKVLLTMANNPTTPYFSRFASIAKEQKEVELVFLCLYSSRPQMIDEMKEKGFRCYWIKYDSRKRKRGMLNAFFISYRLLKQIKPDVVHTHLFDDSLPVLFAARLLKIKQRCISKLDAGFHYYYKPKWVRLDKFNNRNATHIVSVSGENKKFLIEKECVDPDKITLIHQGLNVEEVTSSTREQMLELERKYKLNNRKIALTVSRYIEWKGYRYIIDAVEILKEELPDLLFIFIGYGKQKEELENIVKKKGLEENIVFLDRVDRKSLNGFYKIADLFIHAAINEPFGYVIAEAMLNKIPVITTKTGAAYDSIEHKMNGYLVKKKCGNEIAEGVKYCLKNQIEDIKENAYQTALDLFTVDRMWENHYKLYQEEKNH